MIENKKIKLKNSNPYYLSINELDINIDKYIEKLNLLDINIDIIADFKGGIKIYTKYKIKRKLNKYFEVFHVFISTGLLCITDIDIFIEKTHEYTLTLK